MRRPLLVLMAMLMALYSFSQSKPVTGTVTDQRDGAPIPGVTVTVKGTSTSTVTEPDGSFKINVPGNATTLVFSSVGFQTQEAAIGSGIVNVQLVVGSSSLSEVVITGYTTQSKRQSAGSSIRVAGDELKLQPVGSFDRALQGKVPGLMALSASGQPGSAAEITIRGKGSVIGSNAPLYIIDGIQVSAADFATINPGDIESYNILKDASSSAIYGSRGSNGVIVITTKRGSSGMTRVNYDGQFGFSELPKNKLRLMNSKEKLDYEYLPKDLFDPNDPTWDGSNPFGWSEDQRDSLSLIDNNIANQLFHKGTTQQHMVSASGGNDKTRFFLSGSIFDQQGVVRNTGLKRYTGRANIDNTFGNWKIGLNASFGYSRLTNTLENDVYIGQPLNAIRWFNPYITLYNEDGTYRYDDYAGQPNPLQEQFENTYNGDQLKGIGSVYIEYNLPWVKGLRLRTQWGADYTQDENLRYLDRTTDQGMQSTGSRGALTRGYSKFVRYTGTTSLNYQKSFGDHDINVTVFNEIVQAKQENFGFTGFGLIGPFKNESGITPGSNDNGFIPTVNGRTSQNGLVSYFIDGTYGYLNRYFLNAGLRRDGSSRLSKDNRWTTFGHIGASWIVSDESFMEGTENWLSSLKLKASYGSVGSQGIGDFATLPLLSPTVYNGEPGLVLTNLERSMTWERKLMFNTGVEFALFNNRVNGSVEYYSNTTKDLFLDRQLSRASGWKSITNNLGKLRNQGIEIALEGTVIRTRDFRWSLFANYTHNKNRLLDQAGLDQNVSGVFINKVGHAINSLYVREYAGVDTETGAPLYNKADGTTTTSFSEADRRVVGIVDPPNFGGFGTTLNYKGLELNVQFSYAYGHHIFNNDRTNVENPIYWFSNLAASMLREWQKPGDITDVPSPFYQLRAETTRFVEKADFLRLQNVMLSYSLPKTILEKFKLRTARVFAQGQNLYVWHNVLGYDPEVPNGMLLGGQYPQLKTITFGLNLGL
jgi:TonB-linked SusC/RagA family outer membrane protein